MKKTVLFLIFFITASFAQTQQVEFISQEVPASAGFAQPFDVRFELSHSPEYVLEIDKQNLPEGFEVIQSKQETLSPGTMAYDLTFIPFTLGVSTFTAVTFSLKDQAGGQLLAQAKSNETHIDVKPVQFFKDQTLRDIRPPYIPASWAIWLLCLLAAGLIFYFARRFFKEVKQRSEVRAQTMPDNRPADIIALSKIQLLLQSGLWEKAQYKLFYIELGDILREYFWRRFNQDVSSDTSAELLRRARKVAQLAPSLQLLRDFLSSSDLVKFAKVTPTQETMQKDVQHVQDIIQSTSPQPTEIKEEI